MGQVVITKRQMPILWLETDILVNIMSLRVGRFTFYTLSCLQLSIRVEYQSCSASLGNQHLKSTGMISSLNCFICVWWEGIKFHDNSSVFHFCLFSLIILLSLSPNAFLLLSILIYYMSHAYSSWPSSFKISSFIYHQK